MSYHAEARIAATAVVTSGSKSTISILTRPVKGFVVTALAMGFPPYRLF
jgi:hypothetical protein